MTNTFRNNIHIVLFFAIGIPVAILIFIVAGAELRRGSSAAIGMAIIGAPLFGVICGYIGYLVGLTILVARKAITGINLVSNLIVAAIFPIMLFSIYVKFY